MGKMEWLKYADWVVILNSGYNVLLALAVMAGTAFSIPFLSALAPQYGPISQAVAVIGSVALLSALISICINGLFAWKFYGNVGRKFDGKDDVAMGIVKFVAILTLLTSIATINGLGFVVSAYILLRIYEKL